MEVQALTAANSAPGPTDKIWAGRLIACVDDDSAGPVIADWLLSLPACPDREVVLLGLLPKAETVRTRGILLDRVQQHLRASAWQRVAATAARLTEEGFANRPCIEQTDDPDRIVELAHREGADVIVMVGKPLGSLRRRVVATWASASFASRVADLSDLPVVVLKQAAVR